MRNRDTSKDHEGPLVDVVDDFKVINCEPCGFKHVIPIPTLDELEEVYRHEYYSEEKPLYLERHQQDLDWWTIVYDDQYTTFEEHLPPNQRRILDVGSGPGFFLERGLERGWDALGVEPSKQAAAHARDLGVPVVEKFLDAEVASNLDSYDVVNMAEVLEHVPDPRGMLEVAHELLNQGGLVSITVPNDYNPLQQTLQDACGFRPWWVAPPHHLNYFDFDSLAGLMERSGFGIVHRETSFPMELFLLMGNNYVDDDELGRACHARRKKLEKTLANAGHNDLKRGVYQDLAQRGYGREVFLIGRRR